MHQTDNDPTQTPDETTDALLIQVIGTPRPQPRPRAVGGRMVSTANRHARLWRAAVAAAARAAVRLRGDLGPVDASGGVEVKIWFGFKTQDRARMGQPHTIRPDADNLAKLVLDALVEAGALGGDDARAARLAVVKQWTVDRPGAIVLIRPIGRQCDNPAAALSGEPPSWLTEPEAAGRSAQ